MDSVAVCQQFILQPNLRITYNLHEKLIEIYVNKE